MHLDYRVNLHDQDFVVTEKHKLISSVYAGIVIKKVGEGKPNAVSKHSSSNGDTHATLHFYLSFYFIKTTQENFICCLRFRHALESFEFFLDPG